MKKILLGAAALFTLTNATAQTNVGKCASDEMKAYYMKTLPGYKEQVEKAEAQEMLQGMLSKTTADTTTIYTIPVVFHVLHTGEPIGSQGNQSDIDFINAIGFINEDYSRLGFDINTIDPLFGSIYKNAKIKFELAKKDPSGNCTNGIIRHYDVNTIWGRTNSILNYSYSNTSPTGWNPSKYLNIYVVQAILGGEPGLTTIGYTYKPGQSPTPAADAIVYTGGNWITNKVDVRSLSHEIGHWLGLSHTFGNANNAGLGDCGDDGVLDTPPTEGALSTCPVLVAYPASSPTVTTPKGNTDISFVKIDSIAVSTSKDTLLATKSVYTGTAIASSNTLIAKGSAGEYSSFYDVLAVNVKSGARVIKVGTSQLTPTNNFIAVCLDKNYDGDFDDAGEIVYNQAVAAVGSQTISFSYNFATKDRILMRVIADTAMISSASMAINDGEYEDYYLNVGFAGCADIRPNTENIMDYSSCPKMFTVGQRDKMRNSFITSTTRMNLVSGNNLALTGVSLPLVPCAPIADLSYNYNVTCAGKAIDFTSTSYNATIDTYNWSFTGGTPATSANSSESVTYALPGVYPVALTVTNAQGQSTKTYTNIVIRWNSSYYDTTNFSQTFENGINNGWNVQNLDLGTIAWTLQPYGSQGSSKSIGLLNANTVGNTDGNVDIIETPQYDFSNVSNVKLTFDYSMAALKQTTTSFFDGAQSFKFEYSENCGGTWKGIVGYDFEVDSLMSKKSAGTIGVPYFPNAGSPNTKWVAFTPVNPAAYTNFNILVKGKRDVMFRIVHKKQQSTSNNVFFDNFNISGVVGIEELEKTIALSLYPNPTSSATKIEFTSPVNSNVEVLVTDITGRLVEKSNFKTNAGIASSYLINKNSNLTAGMYVVSLILDGQKVTKKLIINN